MGVNNEVNQGTLMVQKKVSKAISLKKGLG